MNMKFLNQQDETLLWACVACGHLRCVNNHYAKFNLSIYRNEICLTTDYAQITQYRSKHYKCGVDVIMPKFNMFNTQKYIINSAQNIGCTCSLCEQS